MAPHSSRSHPACGAVGGWSVFGLVICGHRWSCWCPPWSSGSHRCHFRCPVPSSGVYNQRKGHGQFLPISTVSSLTVWKLFKDPRAPLNIRLTAYGSHPHRGAPYVFFLTPFLSGFSLSHFCLYLFPIGFFSPQSGGSRPCCRYCCRSPWICDALALLPLVSVFFSLTTGTPPWWSRQPPHRAPSPHRPQATSRQERLHELKRDI